MNKKIAASLLALATVASLGLSYAEEGGSESGPMTSDYPTSWGIASFPFRVVTGVAGMGVGALGGGVKGIIETEKKFAENTFGQAEENPFMVPVGLVGSVVAIPVGFLTGFPQGMVEGGREGYIWWDRF